jgi:glyoxylase-like metal-dependent hydrolase (beta-lactamase superfamily II)
MRQASSRRAADQHNGWVPAIPSFARLVRADNAGPMTLEGTNTWVLRGDNGVVVVDPGPADDSHLGALRSYGPVLLVLLTHGHADHSEAAASLGAPVAARDPLLCRHSEPLKEGDVLAVDGIPPVAVMVTPGHTGDSVCFQIDGALLSGDTLLGRGSTMVAHPDGRLADYLRTLRRLGAWASDDSVLLPGHGPVGGSVLARVDESLGHRLDRLDQVRRALAAGAVTSAEVVAVVYADVDRSLRPAAEATVRAQLAYLADMPFL